MEGTTLGTLVAWHRRYSFGKAHDFTQQSFLKKAKKEKWVFVPVYMYDHSGWAFSTKSFVGRAIHAEWDSGFLGYYYASKEKIREFCGKKRLTVALMEAATQTLEREVEEIGVTGEDLGTYDDEERS